MGNLSLFIGPTISMVGVCAALFLLHKVLKHNRAMSQTPHTFASKLHINVHGTDYTLNSMLLIKNDSTATWIFTNPLFPIQIEHNTLNGDLIMFDLVSGIERRTKIYDYSTDGEWSMESEALLGLTLEELWDDGRPVEALDRKLGIK